MIPISNFYLCAHCKHCKRWTYVDEVLCARRFVTTAKVMLDHNGKGGKRYDEPREVCAEFEPKEQE